jgi:hypothetical protein
MKVHFGGRLFLATAVLGAVALMTAGFFAALAIRSALADPGGPVPNPGHAWTELQDHGIDGGDYWLGTIDMQALELRVNNERALRLEPTDQSPNVIGGHTSNAVTAGVVGAAIGGGGDWGGANWVTDLYGTVGGGMNNQAGDNAGTTGDRIYATVAGGWSNTASGNSATVGGGNINNASAWMSTVGGGQFNTAGGGSATVGGGSSNTASNQGATIAGGSDNNAGGWMSTVGGGETNSASGDSATASGGSSNTASARTSTVGGGDTNTASGEKATVSGGYHNTAGGWEATVGGGSTNTASGGSATVGGGESNIAGDRATVGGGLDNTASAYLATIAGGGRSDFFDPATGNRATDAFCTVGGGGNNQAGNADSDPFNAINATIGGGVSNTASGSYATVGGGQSNTASGGSATVAGGDFNSASGYAATVGGGYGNTAAGDYSFAAGRQASAAQNGCFVWGDSSATAVSCDSPDKFVVQAGGGLKFHATSDLSDWVEISQNPTGLITTSTGGYLTWGGVWTNVSDGDMKENFSAVDGQALLASLAEMPISTWNHKAEDASVRHMGPTAQDFYATFNLGLSDTSIGTLDADGVALAAIQGLYALSQEQDARIDALEARVAALEGGAGTSGAAAGPLSGLTAAWLALGGLGVVAGLVLAQRRRAGGQR